jgi:hypothetical protein
VHIYQVKEDNVVLDFDDIYELENIREDKAPNNIKTAEYFIDLGINRKNLL